MKYNVSIIIPFFNSRRFIKKNFDNIYSIQEKFKEIEIIYIDNNSSDNSYEILKKKISLIKNIRIYKANKKKMRSPGVARNLGLIKSKSKYILFLDIDDYLEIKNLKKIINFLKTYKPNITYLKKKSKSISAPYIEYSKYNLEKFFNNTNNMEAIAIIFNKEFLTRNKITFFSKIYEDIFFIFKTHFYNKKKICFSSDIIYHKYFNKSSITNSKISMFHLDSKFNAWRHINSFLKNKLIKNKYAKLLPHIQYRWRGELANEYVKINRQNLNKKKKIYLIDRIVKKYKRFILKNYRCVTVKDKIVNQLIK